jgi:predicted nucleotidyltransferase
MDDTKMPREGDLLETQGRLIFDVKGLVHPPDRVIAFPRFVPSLEGDRKRQGRVYKKIYALSERFEFLEEKLPHYLVADPVFGERLCGVPKTDIKRHYDPIDRLRQLRESDCLDELEADAVSLTGLLQGHSRVPWGKVGLSGSLLAKLHTPNSDIDPVIYGAKNCLRVHETLKDLMRDEKSTLRKYTLEELQALHHFRSRDTIVPVGDFLAVEQRKALQGRFLNRDFFVRCIRDHEEINENYGDMIYLTVGHARVAATVSDDSEAIFTPCRYPVQNVQLLNGNCPGPVSEISSFRGRFCEHARRGERVVAQGKVEKVQKKDGSVFFRLLLGGHPSDFMLLGT